MIHLIVNPIAGKKKTLKSLEKVKDVLEKENVPFTVHKTTKVGGAIEIVHALTQPPKEGKKKSPVTIVAVGGDGTLHEVLNGIADVNNVRLGVIPSGTGNDFAAAAKIPEDPKKAIRLILEKPAVPTDYLQVGNKRCMNVAGMGMDVDVLVRYNKGKHKNKFKYTRCLLKSLCTYKGLELEATADGKTESYKAFIAAVCNGRQFGGGKTICAPAVIDDGKLDLVIVRTTKGFKFLRCVLHLVKGKILDNPASVHILCDEIKVKTNPKAPIELDGEIYDDLDLNVKVCKGLKIFR